MDERRKKKILKKIEKKLLDYTDSFFHGMEGPVLIYSLGCCGSLQQLKVHHSTYRMNTATGREEVNV